jgi:hypothetical protein
MFGIEFSIDSAVVQAVLFAVSAIVIDAVLGWIWAYAQGEFDLRKMPQFLRTNIFPYIGALLVLWAFSTYMEQIKVLLLAAAGFILMKFLAEIRDKLVGMGMFDPDATA